MFKGHITLPGRAGVPLALLIALSLACVLAACGGSSGDPIASMTPAEILVASRAAAESATSVHVLSKASQGRLSLSTDSELARDGGRTKLSFLGLSYEVIRIANTIYLKGNAAFYRRLFGVPGFNVPQGAWLKGPADTGRLARYAGITDLSDTLDLLLRSPGPLTKGRITIIKGQQAIELNETARLFTGSLAIATTGKPYPLQITKHGREAGQTTFIGWNQQLSLKPPSNTIEPQKLERSGH